MIEAECDTPSRSQAVVSISQLGFRHPRSDYQLEIERFDVSAGEAVAVIGPSGAGKTTLLYLIAGLLDADRGTLAVGNQSMSALSARARRDLRARDIGFVFQGFELLDYLNAWENLLYGYRVSPGLKLTAEVKSRALTLASDLGLTRKLKQRPGQLSGGEKQRVAICRALLPKPKLILADEATGNLDPVNKQTVTELLLASAKRDGAGLIAVTHDRELLPQFDRVIDFTALNRRVGSETMG